MKFSKVFSPVKQGAHVNCLLFLPLASQRRRQTTNPSPLDAFLFLGCPRLSSLYGFPTAHMKSNQSP